MKGATIVPRRVLLMTVVCLVVFTGSVMAEDLHKIYPTENIHAFLELNTATGQIWLCTIKASKEGIRGRFAINDKPLVNYFDAMADAIEKAQGNDPIQDMPEPILAPGRFALIPTQNIWNFILLDKMDGRVWQVQFTVSSSIEERDKYMWIQRIYDKE